MTKTVTLGEICEVYGGGTPPREVKEFFGGDIPWLTPTEIAKDRIGYVSTSRETLTQKGFANSSAKLLPAGSVLMTSRASIGNIAIAENPVTTNQGFISFICSKDLLNKYLAYWLFINKAQFENAANGATFKEISRSTLKGFKLPLPPLPRQRQIAAMLDRADSLRQKDRQLLAHYDQLARSTFMDLFGDPVQNEKGWKKIALGDVGESRLGKMLDAKQQTGSRCFPYLGNSNVQWGSFKLNNLLEMDFSDKDRREFELHDGDLLICEGGEVGRTAIWRGQIQNCYFQKALHRVRLNPRKANPEYVQALMWHLAKNDGFKDFTTIATIAHLTGVKLKSMPIPVPPLSLQQQFASIIERIEQQKAVVQQQIGASESLFQRLLQDSFGA